MDIRTSYLYPPRVRRKTGGHSETVAPMRLRDENKRKQIIQMAAKLFAEKPFDQVRLDDVATAAGVGKGTVYIYFKNKEDLYFSLVYDGFAEMVERLKETAEGQKTAVEKLQDMSCNLSNYGVHHPELFEAMRTVAVPSQSSQFDAKRKEMSAHITEVIRQGVAAGEFEDDRPDLTGLYVPAMMRAAMLYHPGAVDAAGLSHHLSRIILRGLLKDK
jgi:AcrR family transcriptional regulator